MNDKRIYSCKRRLISNDIQRHYPLISIHITKMARNIRKGIYLHFVILVKIVTRTDNAVVRNPSPDFDGFLLQVHDFQYR